MAIEIVDFPIKNGGSFQFATLVITRGYNRPSETSFFMGCVKTCRAVKIEPVTMSLILLGEMRMFCETIGKP